MAWSSLRSTARWTAALGLPAVLLALAWSRADPRAGASLLAAAGPQLALALLPAAGVLLLDAQGWRLLMQARARRRVRLGDAFRARLAGEAVAQTVPWAGCAGEAASAWMLARRTAAPVGRTIGGLAVRRLLLASAHGVILAAAALASVREPSLPLPIAATIGSTAVLLFLIVAGAAKLLLRGAPFSRLQDTLSRRSWVRLRDWAPARSVQLGEADREIARLLSASWRRRAAASACFLLVLLAEAGETFFLLRLLGVPVTPAQVLVAEPVVSLMRSLAFFVPAGLGVQDLGYVSLLYGLGIPNAAAAGAAFVLLKRLKELVWTGAGWTLLFTADARRGLERGSAALGSKEDARERKTAKDPLHLRFPEPDDADASDRARAVGA